MATLTANDKRTEFDAIVRGWEARWRQRQLVLWLPRGVALALVMSAVITGLLRVADVILPELALVSAALVGIITLVASTAWVLRPRPQMQAVRQFERDFGLQERVSTALELLTGRIRAHEEIVVHQLEDAYARARVIDPRATIPLQARWREWAALLPIFVFFGLGLFVAMQPDQDGLSPATTQAIDEAADELRDMMETVATDTTLDAVARDSLLETLETSLDSLIEEPLSAEEAFAALSNAENALRNQAGTLRSNAQSQQEALDAAAEQVQDALNPENPAEAPSLNELLQRMADQVPQMDAQQDAQLAEAMRQAAEMLQNSNPELAQTLQEAAQSLTEAQRQQLQQQLQEAINQAEQAQNQQNQQQQSAENLEQAAQQAQEARENIAQSEQGEPSQSQDGQQPGEEGGESPSQQDGSQSQPGEEGGESSESQSGNAGDPQPSNEGDPTGQISGAPPQQGSESEMTSDQGSNSAGAGDSSSQGSEQSFTGSDSANQENNADGEGETEFEQIFAPQRLNAEGNQDVQLESSENAPIMEGNLQENPLGQASVPYNQVFQSYSETASRALNSGYIPLGLRDVVQDYFTSLEPK